MSSKNEVILIKNVTWSDFFDALKHIFNTRALTHRSTQVHIRNWVEHCAKKFKNEFKSLALPYIEEQFTHITNQPFTLYIESFASLKRIHKLLPFAYFELDHHGVTLTKLTTPEMSRVVSLNFSDKLWKSKGNILFEQSEYLDSLHTINLQNSRVSNKNFNLFVTAKAFKKLHTINFGNNTHIGDSELQILAEHASPGQFKNLDLRGCSISLASLEILTQHEAFSEIETLCSDMKLRFGPDIESLLGPKSKLKSIKYLDVGFGLEHDTPLADPYTHTTLHALESLHIRSVNRQLTPEDATRFAQSPYVSSLKTLGLSERIYQPKIIQELGKSPYLNNLTTLNLYDNHIRQEGIEYLAQSKAFASLEILNLAKCKLDTGCLHSLAHSPYFPKLNKLDLSDNFLTTDDIKALAQHTSWQNLEHLNIADHKSNEEGLIELVNSPLMANLKTLNLSPSIFNEHPITHKVIKALVNSPHLNNLNTLILEHIKMGDEGARLLAQATSLKNLTHLNLRDCDIGDQGGAAIFSSHNFCHLIRLSLNKNYISKLTCKSMSTPKCLPRLTYLNLGHNKKLDDIEHINHIIDSTRLQNLLELDVRFMLNKEHIRKLTHAARYIIRSK